MNVFALEFPEISTVLVWPDIFPTFNKVAAIGVMAVILTAVLFWVAGNRNPQVAPTGARNVAEASIDFIEDGIVMETMGRDGLPWTPLLISLFFFIFLTNITEVIPTFQMPVSARMAAPAALALMIWVVFNVVGIKHHGMAYFKSILFPPGVPKALLPLVGLIELVSTFLLRPFSLAVRLFGNMIAGHLLLVTFAVLTDALITAKDVALIPVSILPFFMLLFLVAFEILVSVLQAYIFTILAAVYIGGALNPEH